jgi:alpha-tubulin suppressor-like RCC1 family protein
VSVGDGHACALTSPESAYGWGYNSEGQLGVGTNTGPELCADDVPCSTRPVGVAGWLAFAVVCAGSIHTCGVTTGHVPYCWGYNDAGQLGDGTTTDQTRPVAVASPAP